MVTEEFPVLVNVTACEALVCKVRLPKLKEVALAAKTRAWAMPVPERATLKEGVSALLANVKAPVVAAAEVGSKLSVKEEEAPGATVSGKEIPVSAKPEPVRDACVTVRFAVPGFFTVMVCVLVTPTVTLPKLTLVGTTEICG